jgi:hypothetical protein
MYTKFLHHKKQKIAKFNMNVLAMLLRAKQRGLVTRKVNRQNNTIRHSLTLITVQRSVCLGYVHAFIEWKSMTKHIFVLIKRYCEQVRRIQRCWKKHKLSQQLRKQALSYFWPRVAIKYKVGLKVSEDVKQKVIALFMDRQNLMHSARYLIWKKLNEKNALQLQRLHRSIEHRMQQLYDMDQLLFFSGNKLKPLDLQLLKPITSEFVHCSNIYRLHVKDRTYSFLISDYRPKFTFIPASIEVYYRLVIKAALTNNVQELV